MACALIGALIPFFVYNVFGRRNKMFLGDAGSHLLGAIFCIMALNVIDSSSSDPVVEAAIIPFAFAVLSHPIMDTLRVMTMRILKGSSPFKADKTHLHHALVGRGLTHLEATLVIILLYLLVVLSWLICYRCGMSATGQMLVVLIVAVISIVLPYFFLVKK
jgi:UDP-N-acetylmuramyl pentapeptide phosphotransferase/UDP-N-acetylglucosamine-1-phosphate transferase